MTPKRGKSDLLTKGDVVLATEHHDGNPADRVAFGTYDYSASGLHYLRDDLGRPIKFGFRRCEKIIREMGEWAVANSAYLARSQEEFADPYSLWDILDSDVNRPSHGEEFVMELSVASFSLH